MRSKLAVVKAKQERALRKAERVELAPFGLLRERARVDLGLKEHPVTNVADVLEKAGITTIQCIDFIRNSPRDEVAKLIHSSRSVHIDDLSSTPIDYLMAHSKIDAQTMIEMLAGAMMTQGANVATMLVALSHPDVMKKAIDYAKTPEGFQDRRMVLQIAGSAPIPKTAITNLTVKGNMNTQINNGSVPKLEDVTRNVDQILEGL